MAEDLSELPTRKYERAEIDTTLPFQSVKAAVSLFGEKADLKKFRLPEKNGAKEAEQHQAAREELARIKLQLACAEKDKEKAFAELGDTKKALRMMAGHLGKSYASTRTEMTGEVARLSTDDVEQSSPRAKEKHVIWESQLKAAQEQHMKAMAELEAAKKEMETLQQQLIVCLEEKENAIKQAEDALAAAELNAKRVEELSTEISGTKESLSLVKMACVEASKARTTLVAEKGRGAQQRSLQDLEQEFEAVHELQEKLAATTEELAMLRTELIAAQQAEEKVSTAAAEACASLEQAKSEIEEMELALSENTLSTDQMEIAKGELAKALDNGASLQASMEDLQKELEIMKKELAELKEREANTSASVEWLSTQLSRMETELTAAVAAEDKAHEAVMRLSQTLQQISSEADEARKNADAMKEEARRAKLNAEQAKSSMHTAESELNAILRKAEAAKAAEAMALSTFKDMFKQTDVERTPEIETAVDITIPEDSCDFCGAQMQQSNCNSSSSNNNNNNVVKNTTMQTQHTADIPEAVINSVQHEVRPWQDEELQKRGREAIEISGQENYLEVGCNSQPNNAMKNTAVQIPHRAEAVVTPVQNEGRPWKGEQLQERGREAVSISGQKSHLKMGYNNQPSNPMMNTTMQTPHRSEILEAIVTSVQNGKRPWKDEELQERGEEAVVISGQKNHLKMGYGSHPNNPMINTTMPTTHRAEMPETSVQHEVRPWKDEELQERGKEAATNRQKNYLKVGSYSQTLPFSHMPGAEPSGQIFSLKIMEKGNTSTNPAPLHKKKKKPLLPSLGAILGMKKSQSIPSPSSNNSL